MHFSCLMQTCRSNSTLSLTEKFGTVAVTNKTNDNISVGMMSQSYLMQWETLLVCKLRANTCT